MTEDAPTPSTPEPAPLFNVVPVRMGEKLVPAPDQKDLPECFPVLDLWADFASEEVNARRARAGSVAEDATAGDRLGAAEVTRPKKPP